MVVLVAATAAAVPVVGLAAGCATVVVVPDNITFTVATVAASTDVEPVEDAGVTTCEIEVHSVSDLCLEIYS